MYCMNCGKQIADTVRYCPYCNKEVEDLQPSGPAEQAWSTRTTDTSVATPTMVASTSPTQPQQNPHYVAGYQPPQPPSKQSSKAPIIVASVLGALSFVLLFGVLAGPSIMEAFSPAPSATKTEDDTVKTEANSETADEETDNADSGSDHSKDEGDQSDEDEGGGELFGSGGSGSGIGELGDIWLRKDGGGEEGEGTEEGENPPKGEEGASADIVDTHWIGSYVGHSHDEEGNVYDQDRQMELEFTSYGEDGSISAECHIMSHDDVHGYIECRYSLTGTLDRKTRHLELQGSSWIEQGGFATMRDFSGDFNEAYDRIVNGTSADHGTHEKKSGWAMKKD